MLRDKTVAVVIPAFNEEKQINAVIETLPEFVDRIIVINDCSTDHTLDIVKKIIDSQSISAIEIKSILNKFEQNKFNRAELLVQDQLIEELKFYKPSEVLNKDPENERIILINQLKNSGVGAAVARGYKWCKDHDIDCIAKIDGDGQMDPGELESICRPIIEEGIDYVKGNRLIHRSAWLVIPKIRYFGNSILSILTKIASGYWHISDTQTAYTAISKKALRSIRIHQLYPNYGYPNDILIKLNIAFCTLKEVEIKPVYDIGEDSKMAVIALIPKLSWLLLRSFFKRLWIKYLFRDFHPLFLLYNFGIVLFAGVIPYFIKILRLIILGETINPLTILAFIFLFTSSFQSIMFAMWMDIQDNERLYKL